MPLADRLDFAQGAALVLNYHTAYFALKLRGRLREGERVLVHGAAGGLGTACLQVAKALGASTVAVVSTEEKERVTFVVDALVGHLAAHPEELGGDESMPLADNTIDAVNARIIPIRPP